MRNAKLKLATLVLLSCMTLQSCLFEDKDVFGSSSNARLEQLAEDTRSLLSDSEKVWVMQYFPAFKQGGYNYVLDFDEKSVSVACENTDSDYREQCLYRVVIEDGVVITMDSFSNLMHQFRNPNSSNVTGKGGDYEFIVCSASEEMIELRGKISRNRMKMYPLPQGYTVTSFLDSLKSMRGAWGGDYTIYSTDNERLGYSFGNKGGRSLEISCRDGAHLSIPLVYTLDGVELYHELNIEGFHGSLFSIKGEDLVAMDGDLKFSKEASSLMEYDKILGTWNLEYRNISKTLVHKTVEFVELERDKSIAVRGLGDYEIKMKFENGKLYISPQFLCEEYGAYLWLVLYDVRTGMAFFGDSEARGYYRVDNVTSTEYINIRDCGSVDGYSIGDLLLYYFSTPEASASNMKGIHSIMFDVELNRKY